MLVAEGNIFSSFLKKGSYVILMFINQQGCDIHYEKSLERAEALGIPPLQKNTIPSQQQLKLQGGWWGSGPPPTPHNSKYGDINDYLYQWIL